MGRDLGRCVLPQSCMRLRSSVSFTPGSPLHPTKKPKRYTLRNQSATHQETKALHTTLAFRLELFPPRHDRCLTPPAPPWSVLSVTLPSVCVLFVDAVAFTLVDIDGDGQVSKNDLVRYLELITAAPEGVKIDLVCKRGMQTGPLLFIVFLGTASRRRSRHVKKSFPGDCYATPYR